jgi:hypothetical protein
MHGTLPAAPGSPPPFVKETDMTSKRSNQRASAGSQDQNEKTRPSSQKGEGRRSDAKMGSAGSDAPKAGKARHKKDGKDT